MQSYPTPAGAANQERMNSGFLKLHPGPPVHVFTEARDELFHDHPFDFTSHVAAGSYVEEVLLPRPDGTYYIETLLRAAGTSHDMPAAVPHRLVALPNGFCVTRAEYGATVRESREYQLQPDGRLLSRAWHESTWQPHSPQ